MKIRFWCLTHNRPLNGEPLWSEGEGAGQWETDTSEMWCERQDWDECVDNWTTLCD